jgi:hypothetical protein
MLLFGASSEFASLKVRGSYNVLALPNHLPAVSLFLHMQTLNNLDIHQIGIESSLSVGRSRTESAFISALRD